MSAQKGVLIDTFGGDSSTRSVTISVVVKTHQRLQNTKYNRSGKTQCKNNTSTIKKKPTCVRPKGKVE